jgi:hypothetical protein
MMLAALVGWSHAAATTTTLEIWGYVGSSRLHTFQWLYHHSHFSMERFDVELLTAD